jgi:hypothetical protein
MRRRDQSSSICPEFAGVKLAENAGEPSTTGPQIERLQDILGGDLFTNGVDLTDLGKLVLQRARQILEANDRALVGGPRKLS